MKLEVCCFSVDCAVTAERMGADRVELCASYLDGGLTPSYGILTHALEQVTIPIHPLIRPREGDFCYSNSEFKVIKNDLAQIRELGYPGAVIGILDQDGQIDLWRMRELMRLSDAMSITFHRAFDLCANPLLALAQLTDLGIVRILTSGQKQSAEAGLPLIKALLQNNRGPVIMAGAGIRLSNLYKFQEIGLQEIHSSAGHLLPSAMRHRRAGVSLCAGSESDEFMHYGVDGELVAAMKNALIQNKII